MIAHVAFALAVSYVALGIPAVVLSVATGDGWNFLKVFHIAFGITIALVYWVAFSCWAAQKVLDFFI